jgi:hypothetical protein
MARLAQTDAHCGALFALASPSPLAPESLQGYVMLVSGHFQGFCRDLYTECAQICTAALSAGLQPATGMPTLNPTEPLEPETVVRIRNSGYGLTRIAEYRGPLGPKGARVYRVRVGKKPAA